MKISLVIPVYNEEDSLYACLSAVVSQRRPFDEIIVVDNNSTDASAHIAKQFPQVKLITEPQQGVVHARNTGFDAATAELIARIDADTILPDNWTKLLLEVFADQTVDAVSGIANYYGIAGSGVFDQVDLFFRKRLSHLLDDRNYLWGSNMAIRSDAWRSVKPQLCAEAHIHEDFDIAIHLQQLGGVVIFDERLPAQVSARRVDTDYVSFLRYVWASPSTYARHGLKQRRHMYPVVALAAVAYLPARLLYAGYDNDDDRFNLARAVVNLRPKTSRVDPTTNVVEAGVVD